MLSAVSLALLFLTFGAGLTFQQVAHGGAPTDLQLAISGAIVFICIVLGIVSLLGREERINRYENALKRMAQKIPKSGDVWFRHLPLGARRITCRYELDTPLLDYEKEILLSSLGMLDGFRFRLFGEVELKRRGVAKTMYAHYLRMEGNIFLERCREGWFITYGHGYERRIDLPAWASSW